MKIKTLLIASSALFIAACGEASDSDKAQSADTEQSELSKKAGEWTEKSKELGEAAWDATKETAGDVADKSKEAYEGAKEKSSEYYDAAKETTGEVVDKSKEMYEGAKEKTSEYYEAAKEKGSELLENSEESKVLEQQQ